MGRNEYGQEWLRASVRYAIDYQTVLSAARTEGGANIAPFLSEKLPFKWRDAKWRRLRLQQRWYVFAVARSNIFATSILNWRRRAKCLTTRQLRIESWLYSGHPPERRKVVGQIASEAGWGQPRNLW
jgi:hypothetical protein